MSLNTIAQQTEGDFQPHYVIIAKLPHNDIKTHNILSDHILSHTSPKLEDTFENTLWRKVIKMPHYVFFSKLAANTMVSKSCGTHNVAVF